MENKEIKVEELTVEQLKAFGFEMMVQLQNAQYNLQLIQAELIKRQGAEVVTE